MKLTLSLLIFSFVVTAAFSQEKLEREYRIRQSDVPSIAIQFIQGSFGIAKIKWYGEENLTGKAIEAKTKLDGMLYSVKFDTSGALQDVEIVVDYNSLPENTQAAITKQLAAHFSKFRIQKTQIQWLSSPEVLSALIKKESVQGKHVINYEITLKGTKDGDTDYHEFLLSENGEVLRKSKIIERNSHNLIY
ncbi:MAG: hypothetical protein V4721_03800 [Bacteroidota bacterium]